MPELAALLIGDAPDTWRQLGFTVDDDGSCWVSGVQHVLGGPRKGIRDWAIRGIDAGDIDGFPLGLSPPAFTKPTPRHPNAVLALDHAVLLTPDLPRTVSALEAVGVRLRRARDADTYGAPMRQAFFRLGEVILEVVGGPRPTGDGPPRFYGLAFTVADLDATAEFLGDRLHPSKDAVQPGRRIATLDKQAGSTVAMAFMSPSPAGDG